MAKLNITQKLALLGIVVATIISILSLVLKEKTIIIKDLQKEVEELKADIIETSKLTVAKSGGNISGSTKSGGTTLMEIGGDEDKIKFYTGLNKDISSVGLLGLESDGGLGFVATSHLYIVNSTVITNLTTESNWSGGFEYIGSTTGMDEGNRYIDPNNYVYEYDGATTIRIPIGGSMYINSGAQYVRTQ